MPDWLISALVIGLLIMECMLICRAVGWLLPPPEHADD